ARLRASGVAGGWALEAQRLLAEDWGVAAETWSATSWTELRRDAVACEQWNLLHPDEEQQVPYVTQVLDGQHSPVVAVSDWIRAVPDQIARWVPAPFTSLGTDGYGFSDTRAAARRFFHVDAQSITLAVLSQLVKRGELKQGVLGQPTEKSRPDISASPAPPPAGCPRRAVIRPPATARARRRAPAVSLPWRWPWPWRWRWPWPGSAAGRPPVP